MRAYKGFFRDLTCRDFQYEEGKEYTAKKAELCKSGFHACEYPLDCLQYYKPFDSVYHEVDIGGLVATDPMRVRDDTKLSATKIKIGARLTIGDLVKAAIEYTTARTNPEAGKDEDHGASSATGHRGASSATGHFGASSATGTFGASSATGTFGASSATGRSGASSATGDFGASSATGTCGASSATGDCGASSATGTCGASSATGCRGASSATGRFGASSATGPRGVSSSTGDLVESSATGELGASSATGDFSVSSATGDFGAALATGRCGAASTTGHCGAASTTGECGLSSAGNPTAIAVAWGIRGVAKGVKGAHIVLADWRKDKNDEWCLRGAKMLRIDGKRYKADTWYAVRNGKVVEAEQKVGVDNGKDNRGV